MIFQPNNKHITSLAQQVSSKSAVNPSLWACFVISLPLFLLASKNQNGLSIYFFIIACLPLIAFLISYLFLLFKNPKYLRSEEYQLRAEAMDMIGDKDNPFHSEAQDIISVIHNPMLPALKDEKHD